MLIDSGATTNILDVPSFNKIKPSPQLTKTKVNIYPYQATAPLTVKGEFTTNVYANNNFTVAKFIVVLGKGGSLLSRNTAEELNLLTPHP